jgi:hypothetical protein
MNDKIFRKILGFTLLVALVLFIFFMRTKMMIPSLVVFPVTYVIGVYYLYMVLTHKGK